MRGEKDARSQKGETKHRQRERVFVVLVFWSSKSKYCVNKDVTLCRLCRIYKQSAAKGLCIVDFDDFFFLKYEKRCSLRLFYFILCYRRLVCWGSQSGRAIRDLESGDGTRWFVSRRLGPKENGGSSIKQSSSSQR
jgi:hypothetical protein